MSRLRLIAVGALLAIGLGASSCGGDDAGEEQAARPAMRPAAEAIPSRVVSAANRNCRSMLRSVKRVGRQTRISEYASGLELTTEAFSEPGLKLVRRLARRQRALRAEADDPRFDAYLAPFDPILVLGEQRLAAGRANDQTQAVRLQDLLTDLGAEQREAAGAAGLRDCDVDFLSVLVRTAFR